MRLFVAFAALAVLSGCAEPRTEGTQPGDCSDGADNDADGQFDCMDSDCAGSPPCSQAAEDGGAAVQPPPSVNEPPPEDAAITPSRNPEGEATAGSSLPGEVSFTCIGQRHRVVVSTIAGEYWYSAWNLRTASLDPSLQLGRGEIRSSGSGVCRQTEWAFASGPFDYLVSTLGCTADASGYSDPKFAPPAGADGSLVVRKNGEEISRQWCVKATEIEGALRTAVYSSWCCSRPLPPACLATTETQLAVRPRPR